MKTTKKTPLHNPYLQYVQHMHKIADIRFSNAVLQWDQETYLPPKGAEARGRQIATLAETSHELFSQVWFGDLLKQLASTDDLNPRQKRNVDLSLEDYEKNKRYKPEFVRKLSEQVNKTFHAWLGARKQNDFSVWEPELDQLLTLKREESYILGYASHPYDAHLNEYDKGVTVDLLDRNFSYLLPVLKNLQQEIQKDQKGPQPIFSGHFDEQKQWDLGKMLLEKMGFDFEAGRQDKSEHPFTISFNPLDVRVTTRINEKDPAQMIWTCIHEGGHALYEQGLPEEEYGLPLGEACSYSIHESQSRFWENGIGRSQAFCSFLFPHLKKLFATAMFGWDEEMLFKSINWVQPSLIRTEADEITYHFHVAIRFELEKRLLNNELKTKDIPHYWAESYKNLLGLKIPDDKQGCLQDVHWAHGSLGYFPTYSMGSQYAAQLFNHFTMSQPAWETEISNGIFSEPHQWLKNQVFIHGKYFNSLELCNISTGKPFQMSEFIWYLENKFRIHHQTQPIKG
jgi:carboxypeptidase Taq